MFFTNSFLGQGRWMDGVFGQHKEAQLVEWLENLQQ